MTATALIANNLPIPSALGSLDAYIAAVNRVPVLSVEDEQALARRYRDEEDLDARSRDSHKRRFLGEPKATRQELADEYGVSAERIRQVEANALKKMRALFAA